MCDNISSNVFKKICPVCGKKYPEEDNFCPKHSELVKLVYENDLVKVCPKCGIKYSKDDNFCGYHDVAVELCHVNDLVKKCRGCGALYPEDYNYCVRCEFDEKLVVYSKPRPHIYEIREIKFNPNGKYDMKEYPNRFEQIDELLSDDNVRLLKEFDFTQIQFDKIINHIIKTYNENIKYFIRIYNLDFDRLHLLDKTLLFSKSIVKTKYKSVKGTNFGHYGFNEIHIDDRTEGPYEIVTIIHELSHFLISELLEQIVSQILDADKTDALEAFVCYVLHKDVFNRVVDEYCAYTVEGRFEIVGYQDFGSYLELLDEFSTKYSKRHLDVAKTIGNTFAIYIKSIIESFIGDDMREEIKHEFERLNEKKTPGVQYETSKSHDWDKFRPALRLMLTRNIDEIRYDIDDLEKMENARLKFKKSNTGGN